MSASEQMPVSKQAVSRGWRTIPLKHAVDLINVKAEENEAAGPYVGLENVSSFSGRYLASESDPDEVASATGNLFEPGDVLFGKLRPYLAKVLRPEFKGRCTSELLVMRPRLVDSRFLRHLCLSDWFVNTVDSSTFGAQMPRADWGFIGSLRVAVPTAVEQRAIADFLDRKTAAIDALVAKKERMLELLAENRQAAVTEAVTQGLKSSVTVHPTGVPWLGSVPDTWKAVPVRRVLRRIEQGWSPQCLGTPAEPGQWGVLKAGAVNSGVLDEDENKALPENEVPLLAAEVHVGDLLMSRASGSSKHIGAVGIVESAPKARLMLCDKIYRLHLVQERISARYARLALSAAPTREQIGLLATGQSTLQNIGQDDVGQIWIAVPPVEEQAEIVAHVEEMWSQINAAARRLDAQLALLREYRQSLITAAVTGQLDVTSASMEAA